jgi:hypothetical protein
MPAIRCPSCGHRHFQPATECINCGEPLVEPYPTQSQEEDVSTTEASFPNTDDDDEIAEYERFLAEIGQKSTQLRIPAEATPASSPPEDPSVYSPSDAGVRIPREQQPEHASHTTPQDARTGGGAASRQLVKRQSDHLVSNQAGRKPRAIQPYEIYETALDIAPPEIFSALPGMLGSRSEDERETDPELWKADKLPWYFPRTKPKVAGKVILIETKEEILDYPDIYAAIATLLVELIWIVTQVQQERENDRIVMTTVRVRAYDGTLKDSRVRGVMRGATISLGDQVSLWGMRRNGVLFVRRGFNHTTQGVISTHSLGLIVPGILVIVAFIAGIYFAPFWLPFALHQFISFLGAFLHFTHTH